MSVSFVATASPIGTPVNTFTGSIGFKFTNTTGVTITVTQLGRWMISGNSHSHTMAICDTSGTSLASVSVNMSGATVGAFKYGTLGSSYDIAAGVSVYFMSSEVTGQDTYYGNADAVVTITNIGRIESAYIDTVPHNGGDVGRMFGPISFQYSAPIAVYSSTGAGTWSVAGDQYSINTLNSVWADGDTATIVPGTYTWGTGGVGVFVSKAVRLVGTGVTVNIAADAPQYSNGGALNINGGGSVSGITFTQPAIASKNTAINCITVGGWRVTGVTYNGSTSVSGPNSDPGYFVYASTYGLIDTCTLNCTLGTDEPVVTRGPVGSWLTANSIGTANSVYMEDCIWNGTGYTDFNSNGRGTVRFNTMNETGKKIDSHGYSTNTPPYGVRQTEAYNNTFTGTSGGYLAFEIRGGLPILFNNTSANSSAGFELIDYGYLGASTTWGISQTPLNYPLFFQIGTGTMVTINATALVNYQRCQIASAGTTDYTLIGSPNNTVGTQFTASGPGTGSGTVLITPATEPGYVFGNTRVGSVWPITNGTPGPEAIATYRDETGNPSATFTGADIILSNRNYYADAGAAANTGVTKGAFGSIGTAVGKTGQGYWATDVGSWNVKFTGTIAASSLANNYWCEITTKGNTDWQAIGAPAGADVGTQFKATGAGSGTGFAKPAQGRLYVSNGATWDLYYTPYTYPHPLRTGTPVLASAAIPTTGATLSLTFSESCTSGAGGSAGVTITASGGASTATYSSGSASSVYVYTLSRTIQAGETVTVSYTQPGNGIESTAAQIDVASFSGSSVTNNSVQGAGGTTINVTTLNVTTLTLG